MDRGRFLRGRERRQAAEEGIEPARKAGHGSIERPVGAVGIAAEREDESASTAGGGVGTHEERRERGLRARAVAGDGEAEREAAARFGGVGAVEAEAVIGLGKRLLAEQVAGEAAVGGEARHRRASALGLVEFGQRLGRFAHRRERGAHPRLGRGRGRPDVGGTPKKADCRLGIAGRQCGPASADQRFVIAGALGEDPDIAGQSVGGALGAERRDRQWRRSPVDILRMPRTGQQERGGGKRRPPREMVVQHDPPHAAPELAGALLKSP